MSELDALHILVAALAGWRIASLIATEHGPWNVFSRLRERYIAIEFNQDHYTFPSDPYLPRGYYDQPYVQAYETRTPFGIGKLISCVWCTSVWTVGAMFVAYEFAPWPVTMIAAMGAAIVVERFARGAE